MMEKMLFPLDFLDSGEVCNLTPESKLLLAATSLHPRASACGVLPLTEFVTASLSIPFSSAIGAAEGMAEAGICAFSRKTNEIFRLTHFDVHSVGEEGSRWRMTVANAARKILDEGVRGAVDEAIDGAPAIKERSVLLPSNLVTSIPQRGNGTRWVASELLVLLAAAAHPFQTEGGILRVDLEAFGRLVSLPAEVVLRCLCEFDRLKALTFDPATLELFCEDRMSAKTRDLKRVAGVISATTSRRVKQAAKRHFVKAFGESQTKSRACRPEEERGVDLDLKEIGEERDSAESGGTPTLSACLDYLRAEGARTKKPDLELDRRRIERIRDAAAWVGDVIVLAVICNCRYPGEAERACESAGIFSRASKEKVASSPLNPLVVVATEDTEKKVVKEDYSWLIGKRVIGPNGQGGHVKETGLWINGALVPLCVMKARMEKGEFRIAA